MRAFSASALLTAWLATGCAATESKACTMLGCVDGFDVAFPDQPSAAGTWSVVVKTPKDTRTCTVKVPFAAIAAAGSVELTSAFTAGNAYFAVLTQVGPALDFVLEVTQPGTPGACLATLSIGLELWAP